MFRDLHAFTTFHLEWFGDNRDRQNTQLFSYLSHDRCGTRSGTTTHAGCDE